MKEAGMADAVSFDILVKALVESDAPEEAHDLFKDMTEAGIQPSTKTFDVVLSGLVQQSRFDEGPSLIECMHVQGIQPSSTTLNSIERLMNAARHVGQSLSRVHQLGLTVPSPLLAAVVSKANDAKDTSCLHEVRVTGSL